MALILREKLRRRMRDLKGRTMFLLCGGEGAAGLKTGGVFFLLVSYAGPHGRGGHAGIEDAARLRARGGLRSVGRLAPMRAGRPNLHSI